jgi:hypothetical protein
LNDATEVNDMLVSLISLWGVSNGSIEVVKLLSWTVFAHNTEESYEWRFQNLPGRLKGW